jgi:UDP-N-acetylglucosamine--N-acetylmuramyl-(pentapeptide) pyrophosphoryl-undecaprenol N-acetylglucosamine transferase
MEAELVKRAGVPFKAIPAAGVHGVGLRALPGNLWRLARGYLAARRLLRAFRPQALFFTGGYVAVPVALASRLPLLGLPRPRILLYVPDIEPGLALKTLARFADRIALTVSESQGYFPPAAGHKLAVTGYPLRPELRVWDPETARQELGLTAGLPVLLVSGGSSGARSLNRALLAGLDELLGEMQVVHLSGKLDWEAVEAARAALHPDLAARYQAFPYLHSERMGAAFAAADLFVGRAGASSLGELPWFGLPAILVPYPYAWRYQRLNAGYLAERGAAMTLVDADLESELLPTVLRLIHNRPEMERMRVAMRSLARPEAASELAGLLHSLSAPAIAGDGGDS